jgi:hypothetical protein
MLQQLARILRPSDFCRSPSPKTRRFCADRDKRVFCAGFRKELSSTIGDCLVLTGHRTPTGIRQNHTSLGG